MGLVFSCSLRFALVCFIRTTYARIRTHLVQGERHERAKQLTRQKRRPLLPWKQTNNPAVSSCFLPLSLARTSSSVLLQCMFAFVCLLFFSAVPCYSFLSSFPCPSSSSKPSSIYFSLNDFFLQKMQLSIVSPAMFFSRRKGLFQADATSFLQHFCKDEA